MEPTTNCAIWTCLSAIVVALATVVVAQIFYNIYWHPLKKIPGPSAWAASRLPFINALIRGTIVHDVQELHKKYGPVLRIAPNEVTFCHPDAWKDIFQPRKGHDQFLKDPTWWKAQPGMPNSLISCIDICSHARMRKLLAPGFTAQALRDQEPIIQRYVNLLIERLHEQIERNVGAPPSDIDLVPWLNYTAFDIFGDLGFGESFDCLQHSRYHAWIELLFNSVKAASFVICARFYPTIELVLMKCIPPSLRKMQMDHYQHIVDKVQRRLNFELERPDIMSHVITGNENADPGSQMSIGELNTTFMVLTTAGSETTATTLAGTLNQLVSNSEKLRLLVREIRDTFRREEDMTFDALRKLPYLNAVISEGLRLCPPIPWMLPRVVPKPGATVCGIWLPAGTPVSIQTYSMNRSASYFFKAEEFLPERWFSGTESDPQSEFFNDKRNSFQPFSIGPRNCMGRLLAWAELRLVISKLLWAFDISAPDTGRVAWEDLRTFLLVEKKPIKFRLAPRQT